MPALRLPPVPGLLRRSRTDVVIALVLALALSLLWTFSVHIEAKAQRKGTESAFQEARTLAQMVMFHWSGTLRQVEALQRLARVITQTHLGAGHNEPNLLAELHRSVALADSQILQVSGIDPAGNLIWSNLPMPPEAVNLTHRGYYKEIANDGQDLVVTEPVLGLVTKRWSIKFAEALRDPDRTLRAITVVSVDAASTDALASELNIAGHGTISVIRTDGVVLARSPNIHVGDTVRQANSVWEAALHNGAAEGLVSDPWEALPRFYAGRQVPGSDLVVMVGLDAADQMASVQVATTQRRQATIGLSFAMAAFAAAISLGLRRNRSLAKERQLSRDLSQREALLRHIAEQVLDIISLQDAELRNIYVSPAIRAVLGVDPQQLIGSRLGPLTLASDASTVEAALAMLPTPGSRSASAFARAMPTAVSAGWKPRSCRSTGATTGLPAAIFP